MLNNITLMGRLTADTELRQTQSGTATTRFTVAVGRDFTPQGQERQADFIDIVVWRQAADFVCKYFQKGSMIAVDGTLQSRNYKDKQGNSRTAVEVVANHISFAGPSKKPGGKSVDDGGEAPPKGYREPAPAYSQGSADDFAVIDDNDDLPF